MQKPQHLKPWDKIATVSLSRWWPWACPERYFAGKKQLEETFGVEVVEMPHTMKDPDRIYQHPEKRAEDLMMAFADTSIKWIISTIGWEESIRLLPFIDLDIIRNNPKVFMGYSDTTISHFMCYQAGLVSFYGPSIMAWFGENGGLFPYMTDSVHKTVFSPETIGTIRPNTDGWTNERLPWEDPANQKKKRTLQPNTPWRRLQWSWIRQWQLLGWCIDVFPFLVGTSLWPDITKRKDKILFLEPSEEKISEQTFERIIRNLWSQGILHAINGIIVWRSQMDEETKEQKNYDDYLLKIVRDECWLSDLPIVTNMDFGHTDPMMVLPIGITAELNCDTQTFRITESACS